MSEQRLNDLDVDASQQGERGSAVAEVVQADRRQASGPDEFVEVVRDVRRVKLGAVLAREDAAGVRPARTPAQPFLQLLTAPLAQHGHATGVERDDAVARVALRGVGLDLPPDLTQLLGDSEQALVEVGVGPAHAARLAAAQPSERHEVVQRVQPVIGGEVEELAGLLGRPHHDRRRPLGGVQVLDLKPQVVCCLDVTGAPSFGQFLDRGGPPCTVRAPHGDALVCPHESLRAFAVRQLDVRRRVEADQLPV